ncbi:MAG: hypothetical protein STSR0008_18880 [Ignavibacterium sp.]
MKRKITLIFLIIIFSNDFIFSQAQLNLFETRNENYIQLNELEISCDSASIKIIKKNENIFAETIYGKKNILTSNNEKYFSIINYNFPSSEKISDNYVYKINYFTFDENGKAISEGELIAIYDLPHPIFKLNNNGILVAFNPYDFKLMIFKPNENFEFNLVKDIKNEMERNAFIQIDDENVYIAATLDPTLIETKTNNVILFDIFLNSNNFISHEIELSSLTMLKLIDNKIILSGISFDNLTTKFKTYLLDKDFNILESNISNAFEQVVELNNHLIASFGNYIFELDENFNVLNKNSLPEKSKVLELFNLNNNIIALAFVNNKYELLNITEKLSYENIPLSNKISFNGRPQIKLIQNKLFIQNSKNTFIIGF